MSGDGLCGALFDTEEGTGVCETFGPHERHSGVVTVGLFRCRRDRHRDRKDCSCCEVPPR